VDFFRRLLLGRNAILAAGPAAEVDHLAPLAAERAEGVSGGSGFLLACRAFHADNSGETEF
jgi:hypothetical protein